MSPLNAATHLEASMKNFALTALLGVASCAAPSNCCEAPPALAGQRVGTFDSRALAMAYYRSPQFRAHTQALFEELAEAKAAGNALRVTELEEHGPALQAMIHKQGFGTWPVDNILELIADDLPAIAEEAGVDVIVSQWQVVHQVSGLELIDVTGALVEPFAPDAQTLDIIESLRGQEPVPLEELGNHQD